MHHEYQLNSFVEPATRSLDSVRFPGLGYPDPGLALISSAGEPYAHVIVAAGSGTLPALPDFSWTRWDHDPQDLPPGLYDVGLVCAKPDGVPTSYWQTQIRVVADPSDPGGFTWSVARGFRGHAGASGGRLAAGGVLAVAILVSVGLLLWPRRGRLKVGERS
jgi:hypothetical protein